MSSTNGRWIGILAALGVLLVASPVLAQLDRVAVLQDSGMELDIASFAQKDLVVGLIGIKGNGKTISAAGSTADWPQVVALVTRARAGAGASSWRQVGVFTESGTSDISTVTVSTGPRIRIVISSQSRGAMTYEIPPADFAQVENAMTEVGRRLK